MNIEVTEETFGLLFSSEDLRNTEKSELANKYYFYNKETEQRGIRINNFVGSIIQYYLTDINA